MSIALLVSLALSAHAAHTAYGAGPAGEGGDDGEAAPDGSGLDVRAGSPPRAGALPEQPFSDTEDTASDEAEEQDQAQAESGSLEGDDGEGAASPHSLRALSCLEGEGGNDEDGARRGVQKRDFIKRRRVELSALGGYHASDALSSTYIYGAALAFFPSEDFGLEFLLARNPIRFRLEEAFTSFDRERHFQSGTAWNALGAMLWSPIHAKLRFSERHITHADLFLVAGGGQTSHQSVQGLTFQVGGGIKLYLTRFVSLRFDVRDLLIPQEVLGRGRTTHNLVTMFGLCAWVPG